MATHNPPRLQIAQILADLSDLHVAEPSAALALVTANSALSSSKPKVGRQRGFKQNSSSSSTPLSGSLLSLSRESSSISGTGSPRSEDPDLERASTLISLYDIRGRMKQQESGGLAKARSNVEAVREKYRRMKEGSGRSNEQIGPQQKT